METNPNTKSISFCCENESFGKRVRKKAYVIISRVAMGIAEANRIHAAVEAKKIEAWERIYKYGIPNRFH